MIRVYLKPRKARPFFGRHPWVLSHSIGRVEGEAGPGAEVSLLSHEGVFIARGLFNPLSQIRVRLYRWEDAPLDEDYWRSRIEKSLQLRERVFGERAGGEGRRLVFSESDGLSGLTVDCFDRWVVAQFTSLALYERREVLVGLLAELTGATGVMVRTERGISAKEGMRVAPEAEAAVGVLPPGPVQMEEHGVRYLVDLRSGQKTGFYLDQRCNRLAAARLAGGQRVLDLFCYTGGFGLCAAKHGAKEILGVDSSAGAIELARENARANQLESARFEEADVLEVLGRLSSSGERFGVVVCDPPKYANKAEAVPAALRGYLKLNKAAMEVLEPGGILVSCSCSGHVDRLAFLEMLALAAEQTGRPIQVIEQRGQAEDHPVAVSCLETDYLKCMICRVE